MANTTTYSVQVLRSGQPRAYADTEREYRITVVRDGEPWLLLGDVEALIARDKDDRAAGRLMGGEPPNELRKQQREWAKKIIRGLCQNFREKDDDDGRTGAAAFFYPRLQRLDMDHKAGTIHVLIIEPFTD